MQYKKDSVRDNIMNAARKEFISRGYRGGNISAIAKNAGVPVGNLYRYFDGKAGVLDAIVKPAYDALPKLIAELEQVESLDSVTLSQTMPILSGGLIAFFKEFGADILILIDCCEGTRYEDFGKHLAERVARVIKRKLYSGSADKEDEIFSEVLGKSFCNMIFEVLHLQLTDEERQAVVERLLKFFFFEVDKRK